MTPTNDSLNNTYRDVENTAYKFAGWYRKHKAPRQIVSLWIRGMSLAFLLAGGLCPLIPLILFQMDMHPWGYFFLAFGGGLLLFDRLFGISSAWMRDISTAQQIEARFDAFR
jgi:hypothetical protein